MQADKEAKIFGLHAIESILLSSPERLRVLWLENKKKDGRVRSILEQAEKHGIAVQFVDKHQLQTWVPGERHQGVVGSYRFPEVKTEQHLTALLKQINEKPFLLVLDGVQDPHNLGACLRTADGAGAHAVIAPKDKSVGLTPVVCSVACGALESVPFFQVTNLARTLRELQQSGVWVVGLDSQADATLFDMDLSIPIALVVGAEGKGLRRLTREHCDLVATLPMAGSVASLNVSVATGIGLFEVVRQRIAVKAV